MLTVLFACVFCSGGIYFEGGTDYVEGMLGFNDGTLEDWGRDQAAAVTSLHAANKK